MLTLRRACQNDVERIHELIECLEAPQTFPFEAFRNIYFENLDHHDIVYIVAEEEGSVVAFGSMCFSKPLHHAARVAEIIELIVDERSRGQTVGEQMINAMILIARGRGCCSLELASNRARERAHSFYRNQGFEISHYKLTMELGNKQGV